MSSTKKFLLAYLAGYIVAGGAGLFLFGPPGLSRAYSERFSEDHEHYLEIVKSDDYKHYAENPAAVAMTEELGRAIAFAESYEARPEFQSEDHRRHAFGLYFDTLNMLATIVLAVRFGRKPFIRFIDSKISETRAQLETALHQRRDGERELEEARKRLEGADAERQQIIEQGEQLMQEELTMMQARTVSVLLHIENEIQDRIRMEELRAERIIRRHLVRQAVAIVEGQLKGSETPERQTQLVDQFTAALEAVE